VPGQAQARRITAALRATSLMPSGLLSGLVTLWINSGQAHAVLDDIRAQAMARQTAVRDLLGETAACHPEGLHAWILLPPHWTSAEFSFYTRNRGLAVVPCGAFTVQGDAPNAVRVALGAAPSTELLVEALKMLPATLQRHVHPEFEHIV
jgi:DNA-binding transcriptional MocR family regulator